MLRRAVSVSRLHAVAWPVLIAWPLGILLVAFAIPWVIFLLVDAQEANVTGSVSAAFGIVLAFYLGAMTQTFPFALGLSITRRGLFSPPPCWSRPRRSSAPACCCGGSD